MVWVKFIASAVVIVVAANFLAKYGDALAIRTKLGGMFIGVLLMAGATSLPEVLTSISAVNQQTPNIAAGNLLGSNGFNMLLLAILDLTHRNQRLLRSAARLHARSGSLAIMICVLVLYYVADEPGVWSVGLIAAAVGVALLISAYLVRPRNGG